MKGKKLIKSTVVAMSLLLAPACFAMESGATHDAMPAVQEIGADMSCGVCMMYPARYPKWQSQVIFNDGKMVPFDGCKDMFKYLLNMAKFSKEHTSNDVAATWVKDFSTGEWLAAKDAIYVVGGEMMGPMGKELIPFKDKAMAASFQKENKGELMAYGEISKATIMPLGMGGMKMNMKMDGKGKGMGNGKGHGGGMMMK